MAMATSFLPLSMISVSGSHLKSSPEQFLTKRSNSSSLVIGVQRKSNLVTRRNLTSSVRAQYRNSRGSGGGDLVVSFLLGGAIFGTLGYIFAPQIRRSLLNEDEHGFRKAKKPIYYDEGLERTRILNEKIAQLNSAIDNISSRLRGKNNVPAGAPPQEIDPEVEATV